MVSVRRWLPAVGRTLVPCVLACGLLGCGSDSSGPVSDTGANHDVAGFDQARRGQDMPGAPSDPRRPAGKTWGDALKAAGEPGTADELADAALLDAAATDQAQSDAAQQQKILNAVPGDQPLLAQTLQESNVPLQLLALDRLGEMAAWDQEARRILEQFRSNERNEEGLRRRAAHLLSEASHPAAQRAAGDAPG